MPFRIGLRDLKLPVSIGTSRPNDVVPDIHVLDLTLIISPDFVQFASDEMAKVFDYDPLIAEIAKIARSQAFQTQEYLTTLVAQTCTAYDEIMKVNLCLRTCPVLYEKGLLGVGLILGSEKLEVLRRR